MRTATNNSMTGEATTSSRAHVRVSHLACRAVRHGWQSGTAAIATPATRIATCAAYATKCNLSALEDHRIE
ncbi:MAG: hypothetical protein M9952_04175 [Microthrixaceae bacterium]|nr:hypothetical protein [Microthrixaceae bacterium]MCO5312119.1 hypothetical protein [Microthrixaceae bacterium]HPB44948.1 hypothetical protein [Microthrixaceae bacterium]